MWRWVEDLIGAGEEIKITQRTPRPCRGERRTQKRRRRGTQQKEFVTLDRKNPPFPPEAGEGWGTLKYAAERHNRANSGEKLQRSHQKTAGSALLEKPRIVRLGGDV